MTPLNYSLKTVTLMIVCFGKKRNILKRIKLFIINRQKTEIIFIFPKEILETFSSPFDQKPEINSPNNSVSTPQYLQYNISLISNGIVLYIVHWCDPFESYTKINIGKKSDKQQQTQKIRFQKLFKILSLSEKLSESIKKRQSIP